MKKITPFILLLPVIFSCSNTAPKDAIIQIGKKFITKAQYEAFEKVNKMYPTDPGSYFPGFRSRTTQLVETELIYQTTSAKFRDSLKNSADWKLKERYYPAQMFLIDYLANTLGITSAEISSYYNAHKESFKVTVTKKDTTKIDSAKTDSTSNDSTYYRTLETVKNEIVDSLFVQKNPPDSAFNARFDSLADYNYRMDQYLMFVRQTLPNFFMKKIYAEVNGHPYPDSISEIFGDDKYITKADLDVILTWIPEARRKLYDTPERQRELVEWLLKWKLFSSYARDHHLLPADTLKNTMEYAWKLNVVYAYVNNVMAPQAEAAAKVDTAMVLYAMYDDNGYTPFKVTDNAFSSKLLSENRQMTLLNLERAIMDLRKGTTISMLQSDWTDIKNQKPDSLFKQAEEFRDSSKINEAKDIFLTLTKEFAFTPEGLNAFVELAKLQTEQQLYSQAISNYRKYLMYSDATEKRCNTFFMIGFIYDEYLDKPAHAEANYKWVLKNTPDCELADDAEFMMLHLNEPMSSVEELRDEAMRQGRKVDATDETAAAADTVK